MDKDLKSLVSLNDFFKNPNRIDTNLEESSIGDLTRYLADSTNLQNLGLALTDNFMDYSII
jgi:hypothetical protein